MGKRAAATSRKAAPKKKAPKQAPKQAPKEGPGSAASSESWQPRKLARHDTEEAADRAIKKRLLPKYSASRVSGAVNKDGQSVVEVVKAKIRENRPLKKNLVSAFWVQVVNAFSLRSDTHETLPAPDKNDKLSKDLLEVVAWAHASNPSDRTTKPLERHLESCEALNYGELHWLVGCCQESPEVVASASSRMFMALTSYCARQGVPEKFPEFWEAIKDMLDLSFLEAYEVHVGAKLPEINFFRKHRKVFQMFVGAGDAAELEKSLKEAKDGERPTPPVETLTRALPKSRLVGDMFADAAKQVDTDAFLARIDARLHDVEHGMTSEVDEATAAQVLADFQAACKLDVQALRAAGHPMFAVKPTEIKFFGVTVEVERETLDDEWQWRLAARLKMHGLNNGQMDMLPWESCLFKPGEIPNAMQTAKVPAEALELYLDGRESALASFGKKRGTFKDMLDIYNKNKAAILGMDRSFVLEGAFLEFHALELGTEKVHSESLGAFPGEGKDVSTVECVAALLKIQSSILCMTCGPTVVGQVRGVQSMISAVTDGEGISAGEVKTYSKFYQEASVRLGNFVEDETGFGDVLRGRAAVESKMNKFKAIVDGGQAVDLDELKALRRFAWLLKPDETKMADGWIRDAARKKVVCLASLTDGSGQGGRKGGQASSAAPTASASTEGAASSASAGAKGKDKMEKVALALNSVSASAGGKAGQAGKRAKKGEKLADKGLGANSAAKANLLKYWGGSTA